MNFNVKALIGYTGFVGKNLLRDIKFQAEYNSKNIKDICGITCDLLVCAGAPAVKWKSNQNPEKDWQIISNLMGYITTVKCKKCILISTVDVYSSPIEVDESTVISIDGLQPYGFHRYKLEETLRNEFGSSLHIIRLPALFGSGLKKNILYDMVCDNQIEVINVDSFFQWYPVERLWQDIQVVVNNNVPLINFATEPIMTKDIIESFFPNLQVGTDPNPLSVYDMHTHNVHIFSSNKSNYMMRKDEVMLALDNWLKNPEVTCV